MPFLYRCCSVPRGVRTNSIILNYFCYLFQINLIFKPTFGTKTNESVKVVQKMMKKLVKANASLTRSCKTIAKDNPITHITTTL